MTLEAYSKYRKERKLEVIAHRKLRSVPLGDHRNYPAHMAIAAEALASLAGDLK